MGGILKEALRSFATGRINPVRDALATYGALEDRKRASREAAALDAYRSRRLDIDDRKATTSAGQLELDQRLRPETELRLRDTEERQRLAAERAPLETAMRDLDPAAVQAMQAPVMEAPTGPATSQLGNVPEQAHNPRGTFLRALQKESLLGRAPTTAEMQERLEAQQRATEARARAHAAALSAARAAAGAKARSNQLRQDQEGGIRAKPGAAQDAITSRQDRNRARDQITRLAAKLTDMEKTRGQMGQTGGDIDQYTKDVKNAIEHAIVNAHKIGAISDDEAERNLRRWLGNAYVDGPNGYDFVDDEETAAGMSFPE